MKDTIWLKGYIVTAASNLPNDSSGIVYVEVIGPDNNVIKRMNPICKWGLFEGSIALVERDFTQGQYLLRAYTRKMQQFGDSLFFTSKFTIIDPEANIWKYSVEKLGYDNGRLMLKALPVNKGQSALEVRLVSDKKTIWKADVTNGTDNYINVDTAIAATGEKLSVVLSEKKGWKVELPINAQTDLQFMPEGGTLVANKVQRVGFKAISPSGKSVEVEGIVKDQNDATILRFKSSFNGMGSFFFKPIAGKTYTAHLNNGQRYPLPAAATSGYVMQLNDKKDSLQLIIDGSDDLKENWVYFSVTTRGIVHTWGRQKIKSAYSLMLDKSQFPMGITVVTLYNEQLRPVNERAVFIWNKSEAMEIGAASHKPHYTKKDSVSIVMDVSRGGEKIAGSFSVSVIDTSQIDVDVYSRNLLSHLLLESDVRGTIEDPYYYFYKDDGTAADLLMLTQRWVSYGQESYSKLVSYEKQFTIEGKVFNMFDKPVADRNVTLYGRAGKSRIFLMDTLSNAQGGFLFNDFPIFDTDTVSIVLKALNKKAKSFNVKLEVTDPVYPVYKGDISLSNPTDILLNTAALKYTNYQQELLKTLKKEGLYLEEVVVTGFARITGSKNLNDDNGADQVINEAMLNKNPRMTLLEVLEQQVKGFRTGAPPRSNKPRFLVNSNLAKFIVDGVDMDFFYQSMDDDIQMDYLLFLRNMLDYFTANEIRGIEVMSSPRNNTLYRNRFLTPEELMSSGPATIDYTFIEITTLAGAGPIMKRTPGYYIWRPLYPSIAKQFYSPKYTNPAEKSIDPDYRSTVYWNPNVITDTTGRAAISFYTSESKGSYIMVIQGTDMKGRFGVKYQPITIKNEE